MLKNPSLIKRFESPAYSGRLDQATVGVSTTGTCGDVVRLELLIDDGKIRTARFLASGCPSTIVSADVSCSLIEGMTILQAAELSPTNIRSALGGPSDLEPHGPELASLAVSETLGALIKTGSSPLFASERGALVAMSGGVDSSVAAALARRDSPETIGISLRQYDAGGENSGSCCGLDSLVQAKQVASELGLAHLILDYRDEFEKLVISPFYQGYVEGITPNPCVECNRQIRFSHLIDLAGKIGAKSLVTGHYVRITPDPVSGRTMVERALDSGKDQSYFFWAADQRALEMLRTPLGSTKKTETRAIAADLGLSSADKLESQDICFVTDNDYGHFLESRGYAGRPGPIVDSDDRRLGTHQGLARYTIGQRRGLGITADHRLYVTGSDRTANTLTVGYRQALMTKRIRLEQINLLQPAEFSSAARVGVMTRYNADPIPAQVRLESDDTALVEFRQPAARPAPGQSAAFYDGQVLLGGGIVV